MHILNGSTMKAVKSAIAVAIALGLLTIFWVGVDARIQEKAQEAVKDTIGTNTQGIRELKRLVEANIKEDADVHPRIRELKAQIEGLQVAISDLKMQLRDTNKRLEKQQQASDELTRLLIEYMQKH